MMAVKVSATVDPEPLCPEEAISLLALALDEEYGASVDPEPDDRYHSDLDWPHICNLRRVISYIRSLGPILLVSALDPILYRGLKEAGVALSRAFLWG